MVLILVGRGRGAGDLVQKLLDGDPVAIMFLVAIVVVTAIVSWLVVLFTKRKGQRLADAIGACEYDFSPDGLFGKRVFVISGDRDKIKFMLTAKKVRKGDYRTYLEIQKPKQVPWEDIKSDLGQSRDGVGAARRVDQAADTVTLEYFGVGGDATFVRSFLSEVSASINARTVGVG
jgi:hypothetical protein